MFDCNFILMHLGSDRSPMTPYASMVPHVGVRAVISASWKQHNTPRRSTSRDSMAPQKFQYSRIVSSSYVKGIPPTNTLHGTEHLP